MIRKPIALVHLGLLLSFWPVAASAEDHASETHIVMLGTGTPLPDLDRAGPSTAVIANGTAVAEELRYCARACPSRGRDVTLSAVAVRGYSDDGYPTPAH